LQRDRSPVEIAALLQEQAERQQVRILLLTPRGQILADTQDDWTGKQAEVAPDEIHKDPGTSYVYGTLTTPSGDNQLYVARSIAKPLQRITAATEEITRGNYDQTLDITSPDEVGHLAASFNAMVHEVKASRQAQRDFVANVSHELKTPLTSIQGFSQAILDGTADDEAGLSHKKSTHYG
jgi:signal transduction histidine kinase